MRGMRSSPVSNDEKASMTFKVVRVLFAVLCTGLVLYAILLYVHRSKIPLQLKEWLKGVLPMVVVAYYCGTLVFDYAANKWRSFTKSGGE